MKTLQVRVDDREIGELADLAEEMRLSRSEIARTALREGVRRLRMEKALGRYLNLEFTLSRAAQHAGVTIREWATATKVVAREVITGKESQKLRDARRGWLEVREVAGARDRWRSLGLGRGE